MKEIMKKTCKVMGITDYSRRRTSENVTARVIVANILLEFGETEIKVGKVMNIDHSVIHYYRQKLRIWREFPGIYAKELNYWNKVNEII